MITEKQYSNHDEILNDPNNQIHQPLCPQRAHYADIGMLDARVGRRRLRKLDPSHEHDLI